MRTALVCLQPQIKAKQSGDPDKARLCYEFQTHQTAQPNTKLTFLALPTDAVPTVTTVNTALAGSVTATAGGATVTIVGTNFRADSKVTIAVPGASVSLTSMSAVAGYGAFTVVSATQITFTVATTAANTGGAVNLRVVNGGSTSTALSTLTITGATGQCYRCTSTCTEFMLGLITLCLMLLC